MRTDGQGEAFRNFGNAPKKFCFLHISSRFIVSNLIFFLLLFRHVETSFITCFCFRSLKILCHVKGANYRGGCGWLGV
jgi:hypothetical protein